MSAPSWDFLVIIFFVVSLIYGLFLKRDSLMIVIVSTYIAYAVTTEISSLVKNTIGVGSFGENTADMLIRICVFLGLVIILTLWGEYTSAVYSKDSGLLGIFLVVLYGVLSSGMIIYFIMTFIPDSIKSGLLENSRLLRWIVFLKSAWIILPMIFLVVSGFLGGRRKKSSF